MRASIVFSKLKYTCLIHSINFENSILFELKNDKKLLAEYLLNNNELKC
jgi:hypothetical protein